MVQRGRGEYYATNIDGKMIKDQLTIEDNKTIRETAKRKNSLISKRGGGVT